MSDETFSTAGDRVFSSEDKAKLTTLINEGITVMQEVDDLTEGLNDTVKAIAEEMMIKPGVLKKAVRASLAAFNVFPAYIFVFIVGNGVWALAGWLWKEQSLVVLNIVITIIYVIGLFFK